MNKYTILDLPKRLSDKSVSLIAFLTWLNYTGRNYTGYKELEQGGIDEQEFLNFTGTTINSKGAIKLNPANSQHIIFGTGVEKERYYLDNEIFTYETDVLGAFKDRNPVGFIPDSEFNSFNEDMFNELPEKLQRWFLKKIKMGETTPAQKILEATYDKYVVRGVPLVSQFPTRERKCDQSKESNS